MNYGILVHTSLGYVAVGGGSTFDLDKVLYMTESDAGAYNMGKVIKLR